jgi:hypothetical protein
LHEEFYALYNGMDPYAPPNAAQMDVDDDAATEGSGGDASDLDDGPKE